MRLAVAFATLFASDAISRGAIFLFGVVFARHAGPEPFGVYALVVLISSYVWIAVDGGVTNLAVKHAAQSTAGGNLPLVGAVIGTRLAAAACALSCVAVFWIVTRNSATAGFASALWAGSLVVLGNAVFLAWYARAIRSYVVYLLCYAGIAITFLIASAMILISSRAALSAADGLLARSLAWNLGIVLMLPIVLRRLGLSGTARHVRIDWQFFRSASWLGAAGLLSGLLPLLPMLGVSARASGSELGVFGAGWQVQQVLLAGAALFHLAFFPSIYRQIRGSVEDASRTLRAQARLSIVAATAVAIAFAVAAPLFERALFGSAYGGAGVVMAWLSIGIAAVLCRYLGEVVVMSAGPLGSITAAAGSAATLCAGATLVFASDPLSASVIYVACESVFALGLLLRASKWSDHLLPACVAAMLCVTVTIAVGGVTGVMCGAIGAALLLTLVVPRIAFRANIVEEAAQRARMV